MSGTNPYYSSQDLYDSIENGEFPSWTWYVQLIPEAEGESYKWDIYDVTKTWCHKDFPLKEVGRIFLNQMPKSHFAEVE